MCLQANASKAVGRHGAGFTESAVYHLAELTPKRHFILTFHQIGGTQMKHAKRIRKAGSRA